MPLEIRDTKTTPREKFWGYPDIEGREILSNSYMNLKREVYQHYTANARPVPTDDEINQYLCENFSVPCFNGREVFRNKHTDPVAGTARRGKKWPFALEPLKLLARDGDKGLGDIVERVIGKFGGEEYKKWHLRIFGTPCSCDRHKNNLNEEYPL